MRPMLHRLLPLVLLVGLAAGLGAQHRDITFTAQLSKDRMLQNGTVEFTLTLRNAQGRDLRVPDFNDFVVLQGPNRTMGTNIVNGAATTYMTFSWMLQPKRPGALRVEPATIRAQNRTYRANSQTIEVLKPDAGLAARAPENFLRAEITKGRAVVGELLILNLNLYSSVRPVSRNLVAEPTFDGFHATPRRQFDGSPRGVIENGREYERRTLGSVALFPVKSGRLRIDPYRIVLGVIRFRQNSRFNRRYTDQLSLVTDTLYVDVDELPRPRPADFSGAVGNFRVETSVNRNSLTTDEAITLRMTVTGAGDIARLDAPTPVNPRDWAIYDPETLEEEIMDSPAGWFGRKVFQYKLVPKRAGEYTLRPALVYYNTDSSAYVTDAPQAFAVTVSPGSGQPAYVPDSSQAPAAEALALRPAGELPPGRRYGSRLPAHPLYWGLALLPLLLAGGYLSWRQWRARRAARDPAEVARERAARLAQRHLARAKQHQEAGAARPFYDATEEALMGYLRDRLAIPTGQLGRRHISAALGAAGATPELTNRYDELLKRCELALYAGQDTAADLADTYATARQLITDTERQL